MGFSVFRLRFRKIGFFELGLLGTCCCDDGLLLVIEQNDEWGCLINRDRARNGEIDVGWKRVRMFDDDCVIVSAKKN